MYIALCFPFISILLTPIALYLPFIYAKDQIALSAFYTTTMQSRLYLFTDPSRLVLADPRTHAVEGGLWGGRPREHRPGARYPQELGLQPRGWRNSHGRINLAHCDAAVSGGL